VAVVAAREERAAREQLGEDAADGPDVDGLQGVRSRRRGYGVVHIPWCTS
jgi:hypothetical protein